MNASNLLAEIQQRGGSLHLDGDGFEYKGPSGSLTPDLRGLLIEHKTQLLAHLRQHDADEHPVNTVDQLRQRIGQATTFNDLDAVLEDVQRRFEAGELTVDQVEALATLAAQEAQAMPENADELRLSQLFDETPIRRVHSKVLDEAVLFATDGAEIPPDNDLVVYRQAELRQLVGCSPERLRTIHASKQILDGELVEDLLEDDQVESDVCPTCHRANWWTDRYGNRKCSICHPRSRKGQDER